MKSATRSRLSSKWWLRALWLVTGVAFVGAAAVVVVVALCPQWLDALGDEMRERDVRRYVENWAEFERLCASDPAAAAARGQALSAVLAGVRKLDRAAPLVRMVESARCRLALQRGDLGEAAAAASRRVEFDDRDVDALVDLGDVLSRLPGKQAEARAMLERVQAVAPAHPQAIPLLCRLLAATGDAKRLGRTLAAARTIGLGGAWRCRWGADPDAAAWIDWCAIGDRVASSFTVIAAADTLRLEPPAWAALGLRAPAITVDSDGRSFAVRLPEGGGAASSVHVDGDWLVVEGAAAQYFDVPLPVHGKRVTVTIDARLIDVPPGWLRELSLGPIGAAALAESEDLQREELLALRRASFAASTFVVEAGARSGASDQRQQARPRVDGDGFTVLATMPTRTDVVEVLLPRDARVTYFDLRLEAGAHSATIAAAADLATVQDGLAATGAAPRLHCSWSLPIDAGAECVLRGRWR